MDTRERLLASTKDLLWERGYIGTSPQSIQRRAQAGQGSMYHHFDGKRGLALAAVADTSDELRSRASAVLDGPGPALQRVIGYLHMERAALRGCPMGRLTQDPEVVADEDLVQPVAGYFAWLVDTLAGLLAEASAAGDLAPHLSPREVASAAVATVQGGYVLARASHDAASMTVAVDGLVALLAAAAPAEGA